MSESAAVPQTLKRCRTASDAVDSIVDGTVSEGATLDDVCERLDDLLALAKRIQELFSGKRSMTSTLDQVPASKWQAGHMTGLLLQCQTSASSNQCLTKSESPKSE